MLYVSLLYQIKICIDHFKKYRTSNATGQNFLGKLHLFVLNNYIFFTLTHTKLEHTTGHSNVPGGMTDA